MHISGKYIISKVFCFQHIHWSGCENHLLIHSLKTTSQPFILNSEKPNVYNNYVNSSTEMINIYFKLFFQILLLISDFNIFFSYIPPIKLENWHFHKSTTKSGQNYFSIKTTIYIIAKIPTTSRILAIKRSNFLRKCTI